MIRVPLHTGLSALVFALGLAGCYQSYTYDPDGSVPPVECSDDDFTCGSGDCVPQALVCDSIPHCSDSSDEAPTNVDCGDACGPAEMQCGDGTWIPADRACDSVFDCADGSDEAPANSNCALPPCVDDRFEDNDCVVEAAVVAPVSTGIPAQICPWDHDYFELAVLGGGTLSILIRFDHEAGDLDLRLLDPDGNVVAAAISNTDDEELEWEIAADAIGDYAFLVYGFRGAQNAYVIDLDFTPTAP